MPSETPVHVERELVYGRASGEELRLDLARPEDTPEPLPCVLLLHGGGWCQGEKSMHGPLIERMAREGYVAASADYRLAPKHRFPAQLEDAKCAVRFLRACAGKYGIDPAQIAALGFSAGAHLSMLLGVTGPEDGFQGSGGWADASSSIQAVVSFVGPTDLTASDIPEETLGYVRDFLGGTLDQIPDVYRRASPVRSVSSLSSPMLLLYGTQDTLVPLNQAYRMVDALRRSGVPGRAEIFIGEGHVFAEPVLDRAIEHSLEFLDDHLKKRNSGRSPL